jgi:hypothetical protein
MGRSAVGSYRVSPWDWQLNEGTGIPVTGAGSVAIPNLDDIEIYFCHWSVDRTPLPP